MSTDLSGQTSPGERDFLLAASGLGVAAGLELFAKEHFMPEAPRYTDPNPVDKAIRDVLYRGPSRQNLIIKWSDRLLYGVSFSSMVWGPLSVDDYKRSALINMEVLAANGIVTNVVKMLSARERPYHHFDTWPSQGSDDFASFFSGHTSVAFSQAVTNAMLLSEQYPEKETLIWSSLLGTAGLTAYLRLASDMHYFTDVLVGAGIGSLIAWGITSYEMKRFENNTNPGLEFNMSMKIPLG